MRACVRVCVCVCVCVRACVCGCVCVCACVCVSASARVRACVYLCVRAYICTAVAMCTAHSGVNSASLFLSMFAKCGERQSVTPSVFEISPTFRLLNYKGQQLSFEIRLCVYCRSPNTHAIDLKSKDQSHSHELVLTLPNGYAVSSHIALIQNTQF